MHQDEFSAVAFYGRRRCSCRLDHAVYDLTEAFHLFGLAPDYAELGGKTRGYKHVARLARRFSTIDWTEVSGVDMLASCPGAVDPTQEYCAEALVSRSPRIMAVGWRSELAPLSRSTFLHLLAIARRMFSVQYGIAYHLPGRRGPMYYPAGIIYGRAASEEDEKRLTRWNHALIEERHAAGLLRSVYAINLLNEGHLSRTVFNSPLETWIRGSADRGSLEKVNRNQALWLVPVDCKHRITRVLAAAGLLIEEGNSVI